MIGRRARSLEGKTAVITGGTRGVGKALVEALAHRGVNVALCARDPVAVDAVARDLGVGAIGHVRSAVPAKVEPPRPRGRTDHVPPRARRPRMGRPNRGRPTARAAGRTRQPRRVPEHGPENAQRAARDPREPRHRDVRRQRRRYGRPIGAPPAPSTRHRPHLRLVHRSRNPFALWRCLDAPDRVRRLTRTSA
jgi:short chain dehydrogenase